LDGTDYYKSQKRSNRNVIVNILFAMTSRIGETRTVSSCVFTGMERFILYSQCSKSYNMNLNSIE